MVVVVVVEGERRGEREKRERKERERKRREEERRGLLTIGTWTLLTLRLC